MATLHELITKVIPLKGILRTPSYWMRKVLTAIADAVEAVDAKLVSVSDKLAHKDDSLTKAIFYAKTGEPFFVLKEGTKMIVDDNTVQAEPYTVYKAKSLTFRNDNFSATSVDFLISLNIPAISFNNCTGLTSLDLSNFDTSKVTNMYVMFSGCIGLTSLDLSNFDTSAVTNMHAMFSGCSGLTSLNLSSFNTSAVTNMNYMFSGCTGLTSLNLSSFNTSAVTNMSNMFGSCTALTSLNLSNFNTSAVTSMQSMFSSCSGLTSLNLSNFNTSAVTNMRGMFGGCRGLTSLDVSNFDTSKVTNMRDMFRGCTALRNIKCKQAFKDWCAANASTISLTVSNITWEIVE